MINIIYEDNHLLVALKPVNVPSQKDETLDNDMLSMLKDYLKEKYDKKGNVYLGLVHRLDRPTSGIMVFAKTSKAASRLSTQIRDNTFEKEYHAIVLGNPNNGQFIDYLIKDSDKNIVNITSKDKGKKAILAYETINTRNNLSLVKINLVTGRSHQIRVQFSHHGYPLWGDNKYNETAKAGEQLALFANKITFIHPIKKERVSFETLLPSTIPWNSFN